eukprot:gene11240-17288_t
MREVALCANVVTQAAGRIQAGCDQLQEAAARLPALAATFAAMERMKRDPTIAFVRYVRSMERGHEQAVADALAALDGSIRSREAALAAAEAARARDRSEHRAFMQFLSDVGLSGSRHCR